MKLYERIEYNNFDEIDRNRAIELIENGNGHLVYNENYFKLQKENEELKENYINAQASANIVFDKVIPVQKVKDKIEEYKKLGNEFYEKFLETNKTDINIHDTGISCDAKVQVLQELLEGK